MGQFCVFLGELTGTEFINESEKPKAGVFWTRRADPGVSGKFVEPLLENISSQKPLAFRREKRQTNWWKVVPDTPANNLCDAGRARSDVALFTPPRPSQP